MNWIKPYLLLKDECIESFIIELCSEFVSQSFVTVVSLKLVEFSTLFDSRLAWSIFEVFELFLYLGISSQIAVCSWVVQQQYMSHVQLLQSLLPHPVCKGKKNCVLEVTERNNIFTHIDYSHKFLFSYYLWQIFLQGFHYFFLEILAVKYIWVSYLIFYSYAFGDKNGQGLC